MGIDVKCISDSPVEPSEALPELLELVGSELVERLGGRGRAATVYSALRSGRDPFADASIPAGARARLARGCRPSAVRLRAESISADGTVKLLLGLSDGQAVETVLIPCEHGRRRTTLCVSTQVGCARGCIFCLTATMKLTRSLGAHEILAQVVFALSAVAARGLPPLRNLVFMGMGEPLDNFDAVERALAVITDSSLGLGFGPGHVTVSTVAPSPRAIFAAARLPARLAWSLHAADDALRRRLVPTQRASVAELYDAFRTVCRQEGSSLFVEMTLIAGLNDRDEDADRAAALFADFGQEVRFNLLPMNAIDSATLQPASPERVAAFDARLRAAGFFTRVRRARGDDERAACGQLAVLSARRPRTPADSTGLSES